MNRVQDGAKGNCKLIINFPLKLLQPCFSALKNPKQRPGDLRHGDLRDGWESCLLVSQCVSETYFIKNKKSSVPQKTSE